MKLGITHKGYWSNIKEGTRTLLGGLGISWDHFKKALIKDKRTAVGIESDSYFDHKEGIFTNRYPNEAIPVPDTGRYRLDNVIEDCIVCDKCAKICPVNCIEIEAIRSPEEIRKTSDGSSVRLYAAKFDIDMAKCCFCGLCTTVCPTECLTMTKTYDFSEEKVENLTYNYSDLSPETAQQKQEEFDIYMAAKKQNMKSATSTSSPKPKMAPPTIKKNTDKN